LEDLYQGLWKFDENDLNSDSEFGFEGKKFDILLDIGVGLGSELKFESRDLDFN
jgi:hypothetical protein